MNPDSETDKPVRLKDRLRDEADRAILAAAEEVFSQEGLGAPMERIATRAGVAVGTLYNHFEDRKALVEALSCSRREKLLERLDASLAETAEKPVREQLRGFLDAVSQHAREHGRLLTALVQAGEGPARARPTTRILDAFAARAELLVRRGIESGELRPEGGSFYATALVGMIRAGMVRAVAGEATWEEVTSGIADLFLRGAGR